MRGRARQATEYRDWHQSPQRQEEREAFVAELESKTLEEMPAFVAELLEQAEVLLRSKTRGWTHVLQHDEACSRAEKAIGWHVALHREAEARRLVKDVRVQTAAYERDVSRRYR